MHITARYEGGVQRRVIAIPHTGYLAVTDGKHTRLTIAIDLTARHTLHNLFRYLEVTLLGLPMVYTMTGNLMSIVHNTLHQVRCLFSKITRAEEGCPDIVLFQYIEDTVRTFYADLHTFCQREIHAMLTRYVELLCIKTQQYHVSLLLS